MITQSDIDQMSFAERCARALVRLELRTPPEGMTWDSLDGPWHYIMRYILYPILEPTINTEPRTVYCDEQVPMGSSDLVVAALADCALQDQFENENAALGACLTHWMNS